MTFLGNCKRFFFIAALVAALSYLYNWQNTEDFTDTPASSYKCNIDRIGFSNFSADDFHKKYYLKKPLLISFAGGASEWTTDGSMWTLDYIRKHLSSSLVLIGDGVGIVQRGGHGDEPIRFQNYLDLLKVRNSTERRYIFSRLFFRLPRYQNSLKFPRAFQLLEEDYDQMFFFGGRGSGVGFHKHADSWNGLAFGQKRWFLYGNSQQGAAFVGYDALYWSENILPLLKDEDLPFECVQEAGEILYIPESFYHATVNLGISAAVGMQRKLAVTRLEKYFYAPSYQSDNDPGHLQILQNALKEFPDNIEFQMKLALYRWTKLGDFKESAEKLRSFVARQPLHLPALIHLAEITSKFERIFDEGKLLYERAIKLYPFAWEVYARYADLLTNFLHDDKEAIRVLEKGVKVQNKEMRLWSMLQQLYMRTGNKIGEERALSWLQRLQVLRNELQDIRVDF